MNHHSRIVNAPDFARVLGFGCRNALDWSGDVGPRLGSESLFRNYEMYDSSAMRWVKLLPLQPRKTRCFDSIFSPALLGVAQ